MSMSGKMKLDPCDILSPFGACGMGNPPRSTCCASGFKHFELFGWQRGVSYGHFNISRFLTP
jgi:hypothetical protein